MGKVKVKKKGGFGGIILLLVVVLLGGVYFWKSSKKAPPPKKLKALFVDVPVKIYNKKTDAWVIKSFPFEMSVGDIISTGNKGRTILSYENQVILRISPQSIIHYVGEDKKGPILGVEKGKIFIESLERCTIKTDRASVLVKDGKVEITDNGYTSKIYCYKGNALVESTALKKNRITLKAKEKVFVNRKNEISPPAKISKVKDRWTLWNLSFSGTSIIEGKTPPPLKEEKASLKKAKDEAVLYFPVKRKPKKKKKKGIYTNKDGVKVLVVHQSPSPTPTNKQAPIYVPYGESIPEPPPIQSPPPPKLYPATLPPDERKELPPLPVPPESYTPKGNTVKECAPVPAGGG